MKGITSNLLLFRTNLQNLRHAEIKSSRPEVLVGSSSRPEWLHTEIKEKVKGRRKIKAESKQKAKRLSDLQRSQRKVCLVLSDSENNAKQRRHFKF